MLGGQRGQAVEFLVFFGRSIQPFMKFWYTTVSHSASSLCARTSALTASLGDQYQAQHPMAAATIAKTNNALGGNRDAKEDFCFN